MKKQMHYVYLFIFLIFAAACTDEDNRIPSRFDEPPSDSAEMLSVCLVDRQCNADPYRTFINGSSDEDHVNGLISFFKHEGLSLFDASVNRNYYEAVCQACYICPSGVVYSVDIRKSQVPDLLGLNIWLRDCNKDVEYVLMSYEETKCADPWPSSMLGMQATLADRKEALATFLLSENVVPGYIEVNESGNSQDCEACVCTTGRIYQVLCQKQDVSTMLNIGFEVL